MKLHFLFFVAASVILPACATKQKASGLEETQKSLQNQLSQKDSILKAITLSQPCDEIQSEYRKSLQVIEQLRATNLNLHNNYQEMLAYYSESMEHKQEILNQSVNVHDALRTESSQLGESLETQMAKLREIEQSLLLREQRIQQMEENYRQAILERNEEISLLENQLQERGFAATLTQGTLNESLKENIANKELNVTETAGRIYITVSQDLLFAPGSAKLDAIGKKTLRAVAIALNQEPDMDILIEGHTDNTGPETNNWELSLNRAMSVFKELEINGLPAYRMTIAGRGPFAPVATNATKEGQALNRRTEIILVPRSLTNPSMQKY